MRFSLKKIFRKKRMAAKKPVRYSVNKRKVRLTLPKILAIAGGVVAAIVLVLVLVFLFGNNIGRPHSAVQMPIANIDNAIVMGDGMYYLKGTALIYAEAGEDRKRFETGFKDVPHLTSSDTMICVYDSQQAYVLSADMELLFSMPISAYVIESMEPGKDCVAVLTRMADGSEGQFIRIFDSAGQELMRNEVTSETLKFGLYGDKDDLWYLTLDTSGAYLLSNITTISPSQQKTTGLVSIADQLVADILFNGTDMIVSGTKYQTVYDIFGDTVSEELIYGQALEDTVINESGKYFLVYVPRKVTEEGFFYTARLLSLDGSDVLIQLPAGIHSISLSERNVYCFAENTVYIYDYSGKYIDKLTFEFDIEDTRKLSDTLLLMDTSSGVYVFTMR